MRLNNSVVVSTLVIVSAICFIWNSAEAQGTETLVDSTASLVLCGH